MIAITIPKPVDHHAAFSKAQARMRAATTHADLDKAIGKLDIASASIITMEAHTGADRALQQRAQDWVRDRVRHVGQAHEAIRSMDLYRQRRVAADRPYARKPKPLDKRAS